MIEKWTMFNFKSIRQETDLELAPLTLFAGPNSSGKSTVLQSILLIAQTLAHKVGSRSVVLNGALAKLGQFDDLRSADAEANQILVGWECRPRQAVVGRRIVRRPPRVQAGIFPPGIGTVEKVACDVSFDANPGSPQRELHQLQPRLFSSNLTVTLRGEDYTDLISEISLSQSGISGPSVSEKLSRFKDIPDSQATRSSLDLDVELDNDSVAELKEYWNSAQVIGCELRHFLPSRLTLEIDPAEEIAQMVAFSLLGELPRAMRFGRDNFLASEGRIPASALEKLSGILLETVDTESAVGPLLQMVSETDEQETIGFSRWFHRLRKLSPHERDSIRRLLEESDSLVDRIIQELRNEISAEPQLAP